MHGVLQEQRFERVGGSTTVATNVRLIADTHQDLERLNADGRFSADLYHRLNVFTIGLPPLRDRPEAFPTGMIPAPATPAILKQPLRFVSIALPNAANVSFPAVRSLCNPMRGSAPTTAESRRARTKSRGSGVSL
jgi:transcriptional regulator with GAF, ATPase, and Fis domain